MQRAMLATVLATGTLFFGGMAAPQSAESTMAPKTARGHGHFRFGDEGLGRAMFHLTLDATDPDDVQIRFQLGAEFHHTVGEAGMYPDYHIKLHQVDEVEFDGHTVELAGWGLLTGQLYHITVKGFDGNPTGQQDWIHVIAIPDDHHLDDPSGPFEAKGELRTGDLVVGAR